MDPKAKPMIFLFSRIKYFFITTFMIALLAVVLLLTTSKAQLHLFFNSLCSTDWDGFFKVITWFGDGGVVLILALLIALPFAKRKIWKIFLGVSICLIAGILAQFFKKVVFNGTPRPVEFFADQTLYLVEGVKVHHWNTFPSGHTTSIFALMLFAAFVFAKYKWAQVIFGLFAWIVAFSRVYLSQHFLEDVVAGMILAHLVFFAFYKTLYSWSKVSELAWS